MNRPIRWSVVAAIVSGLIAFIIVLSACSDIPTADRVEGGRQADTFVDATQVTLVRNVDNVPNVAIFCGAGERFAATLSVDGQRSPSLEHLGPCS